MAPLRTVVQATHAHTAGVGKGASETIAKLFALFRSIISGTWQGSAIAVKINATQATATITLTSVTAGYVIRVLGVPFTAILGTPTVANNEFDVSGNDTADAASLAAAINASALGGPAGTLTASSASNVVTLTANTAGLDGNGFAVANDGLVANGTVTYVTPAGAQTISVNGVSISGTAGATAAATATAMAAAINASTDPLVAGFVRALARAGVVAIYAIPRERPGNAITLAATGTGATASGARLTAGSSTSVEGARASGTVTISSGSGTITATINGVAISVTWSTDDATTAAALASAINNSTNALVQYVVGATAAAGVVTVTAVDGGISGNAITLAASGTGATASGARLTGGAAPTTVVMGGGAALVPNGSTFGSGANDAPLNYTF